MYFLTQELALENEEFDKYIITQITKKALGNHSFTPVHCAAINPNSKYLKELCTKGSERDVHNVEDYIRRKPIHFAAGKYILKFIF